MNSTFLMVIKVIVTILLLPLVWAAAVAFHQFAADLPGTYDDFFFWGMFGFVLIFLFFYQFWGVYEFGQRMVSGLLQFTSPFNHFIAKIVPFYVTLILLLFYVVKHFLNIDHYDHYFMFFTGFALTMHVILTAQDLQETEKDFIKPAYMFVMACAFILMVLYVVLLFNLVLKEFTFLELLKTAWEDASGVYYFVLHKIFRLK
jgi:hypothetical protein